MGTATTKPLSPSPTGWMFAAIALVGLGVAAPTGVARAGTAHTVYLLAPGDPEGADDYRELWRAVQAHLTALPVSVRLMTVDEAVDDALALDLARDTNALLVAWLSADRDKVHHLVPAQGDRGQSRDLGGAGEGWLDRCQVVAAMIHAELGDLEVLQQATLEPENTESPGEASESSDQPETGPPVVDPAETAPAVTGNDELARPPGDGGSSPRRTRAHLLISAGYTLFRPSSAAAALHGVGFGLGLRVGRHVGIHAGADLGQATPLAIDGGDGRIVRWPVRLSVTGEVALGRLDLTGRAGILLDVSRVTDLSFSPGDTTALDNRLDLGLALGVEARFRILPWLAPFVAAGLDLYDGNRTYELSSQPVASRGAAVPRLVLGATWILGETGE